MRALIRAAFVVALGAVGLSGACSSDGGGNGTGGSGKDGDGDMGGSDSDGTDGVLFGNPDGGGGGIDIERAFAECAAETASTEAAPLDIYIMFDQSCSMSCPPEQTGAGMCCMGNPRPRIDQVRSAVRDFLQSPDTAGIGVGIGYFGYQPAGQTSCDPGAYSQPAVPIGLLPGNAPALIGSLDAVVPIGETPTGAAIRGACRAANAWKASNPSHSVVILLVTDGVPEVPVSFGCNANIGDAEMAAAECALASPAVSTYVLGVGANLGNLNRLAVAGGTGQAYLVDASPDVSQQVLDALNAIRDAAVVPCDFQIPPPPSGDALVPGQVNVTYDDAAGNTALVPGVADEASCGVDGGWFYDDPNNPSIVRLCANTCDRVTAALIAATVTGRQARLDLKYGCDTITEVF